jgi:hypothetical protein
MTSRALAKMDRIGDKVTMKSEWSTNYKQFGRISKLIELDQKDILSY